MNIYKRYNNYIPNYINHIVEDIKIAVCDQKYEKGDIITVQTDCENNPDYCIVWNYLGYKHGKNLYSITRPKYKRKSKEYIDQAVRTTPPMYMPLKRAEAYLVEEKERLAKFRQKMDNIRVTGDYIPISIPESIEYFHGKLRKATIDYEGMKNGRITHLTSISGKFFKVDDVSIYWAKRRQRELTEKYRTAKKLWSTDFINNDSSHYLIAPEGDQRESFSEFLASSQGLPKKQQEKPPV